MGKNLKKRTKQSIPSPVLAKKQKLIQEVVAAPIESDSILLGGVLYPDELETTTETLALLSQHPELISHKALKGFRTSVHDYWRVSTEVSLAGNSLTSRISSALIDHRHVDALVLLSEMAIREQMPKLGALQRWVRECDAVLTPEMSEEDQKRTWQVLDAILRTTQPELISTATENSTPVTVDKTGRLRFHVPFQAPTNSSSVDGDYDALAVAQKAASDMSILESTPGPSRRPPNKHPAIIYHSPPDTFRLLSTESRRSQPARLDVPGVPGAFLISSVFDPRECDAIVKAAETVGLQADEPTSGSAVNLSSVLAHNLIWLADEKFIEMVYGRIKELLPQKINGGEVKGINARFRLYRYRPGALYRPHIDGAWPASAKNTTATPPSYIYDSDPSVYSRLTMLIYLNDDFDGGCTTFFLPSATPGVLDARPVKPRKGTVAFFPHGAARGSLLHEGSGVEGEGAKYVIRTEVLYEVDQKERIVG